MTEFQTFGVRICLAMAAALAFLFAISGGVWVFVLVGAFAAGWGPEAVVAARWRLMCRRMRKSQPQFAYDDL